MQRHRWVRFVIGIAVGMASCGTSVAQEIGSPEGIRTEQSLPSRYPFVVQDMLRFCKPHKGFWVDLGAGKGQVAIPLIEKMDHPVTMVDPDVEALADGLEIARQKGIEDQLFAVVGVAEELPFPDNSVDLVVSRGSIFFWDKPAQGLREVYRVLRPGCRAYIGGGAGSGYPAEATAKLIEQREQKLQGEQAEKWKDFIRLRRPERMQQWARDAGLPDFQVMGMGAISADDERVGQGVWVFFEKQPEVTTRKEEDAVTVQTKGDTVVYDVRSPSGIGGATIRPWKGWADDVVLRLHLAGLESLVISNGPTRLKASVLSHSGHTRHLHVKDAEGEREVREGDPYWMNVESLDAENRPISGLPGRTGSFRMQLPAALLDGDPKLLSVEWIDFYR